MAPTYSVTSATYDSVTVYINRDTANPYYRIYIKDAISGAEVYDTVADRGSWLYLSSSRSWTLSGLTPGTSYIINVAYSPDGTAANSTWIGAQNFATEAEPVYCYAQLAFDANGGTGAPDLMTGFSTDGSGYVTFEIPSYTIPSRDGYVFAGWATNSAGTGTIRYPGDTYTGYGTTTDPGPLHTLYAVWEAATYFVTIKYNANGGTGAPSAHTEQGKSSSLTVQLSYDEPTRDGYTFDGWATSATAGSATHFPGQILTNVYATTSGYVWNLYAVWSEKGAGSTRINTGEDFDRKAVPYIWDDGWHEAGVRGWDGRWKEGE